MIYASVSQIAFVRGLSGVPKDEYAEEFYWRSYLQMKLRATTFDTNHSITDSSKSVAASIQKLLDSVVKSLSRARHGQSQYFRRNDQVVERV